MVTIMSGECCSFSTLGHLAFGEDLLTLEGTKSVMTIGQRTWQSSAFTLEMKH